MNNDGERSKRPKPTAQDTSGQAALTGSWRTRKRGNEEKSERVVRVSVEPGRRTGACGRSCASVSTHQQIDRILQAVVRTVAQLWLEPNGRRRPTLLHSIIVRPGVVPREPHENRVGVRLPDNLPDHRPALLNLLHVHSGHHANPDKALALETLLLLLLLLQ